MPKFLKLVPPREALEKWLKVIPQNEPVPEVIKTTDALGRISTEDIKASHPLPTFSRSTMDGYAVRAADTYGASESLPAFLNQTGEILMGQTADIRLGPAQTVLIHTGGMLPENADAVVMLENTQTSRTGEIQVMRSVAPLENIIQIGEDVQTGQVVIPKGTRIRAAEIGGLMAFGLQTVRVARRPRIGILSSGDEVVPPDINPTIGQVRDINSYSLSALITEWGGEPVIYGIVPDKAEALEAMLAVCLCECDGAIITAGSSASSRDLTAQVIQKAGQPGIIVHGINIRPGKPTILAVCSGKPVIGLPGNPISSLVIAWLFVPRLLERMLSVSKPHVKNRIDARLTINVASLAGREDWIPVKLSLENEPYQAEPIFFKSNLIFNLVKADGLMFIPADVTGMNAGESVQVFIF